MNINQTSNIATKVGQNVGLQNNGQIKSNVDTAPKGEATQKPSLEVKDQLQLNSKRTSELGKNNMETSQLNTTTAGEKLNAIKDQLLRDADMAKQAQANQAPQSVLQLLK